MTATVTDLFCGAGGSSLGAEAAGLRLVMAANHWDTAIDVHQQHFPEAGHDCADVSQVDPRRYPRTDILLASPECTNHSQARGVSRRKQQPSFFDAPDPSAERSRATMWDVPRFAEQLRYDAIVVENVVEATKWVGWRGWCLAMEDLGYDRTILSHNSMHHGVAQSRDRIYVVFTRKGLRPNLELELQAWCPTCEKVRPVRQGWKPERTVGRYRQQWMWCCTTCGDTDCEPSTRPAADIIDWDLDCPRIGDRKRPLAKATRKRILAGLQRYGWVPVVTAGAGNTYEATPGNRARPLSDPLPVQTTTATHALARPPAFLASITRTSRAQGGLGAVEEPMRTQTAQQEHGLVVPCGGTWNEDARATDEPMRTLTGSEAYALLMRNNRGGAEMTTPVTEPARTVTSKGHQSLLVPYYGNGQAQPVGLPVPTVPTRDRFALVDPDQIVALLPEHRVYVEPYCGSLAVFLAKPRSPMEVVNDIDGDVVNFWRVLREHHGELERRCALTPYARAEYVAAWDATDDPIERARRFWVRAEQGVGGKLFEQSGWQFSTRANARGITAEPMTTLRKLGRFSRIAGRLAGVYIENCNAVDVMLRNDGPDTVHYLDPPYVEDTVRRRQCYVHGMTDQDHRELAAVLETLQGTVVLSGYASPLYDELFGDWHTTTFRARARTANRGDAPADRTEVVWSNRPLTAQLTLAEAMDG